MEFLHADHLHLVAATSHPAAAWPEPWTSKRLHGQSLIVGRVEYDDCRVLDELFSDIGVVPVHVAESARFHRSRVHDEFRHGSDNCDASNGHSRRRSTGETKGDPQVGEKGFLATREGDDSAAVSAFRQTAFRVMQRPRPLLVAPQVG